MHNGPTNPWSKSNSPSLRQNQGVSGHRPSHAQCGDLAVVVTEVRDRVLDALGETAPPGRATLQVEDCAPEVVDDGVQFVHGLGHPRRQLW